MPRETIVTDTEAPAIPRPAAADASSALSALSAAWTTYRLYPSPGEQPAFARAVETLGALCHPGLVLEVGAGSFLYAGEEIGAARDGAERLARALFVRDIEAIGLPAPPAAADLVRFFDLVEAEADEDHPVALELRDAGVETIVVHQRGLLEHDPAADATLRHGGDGPGVWRGNTRQLSELASLIEQGATPESVAEHLMHASAGEPRRVTEGFVRAYLELHQAPEDVPSHEQPDMGAVLAPYWEDHDPSRMMRTFVDAFFHLPDEARVDVLESFLDRASMSTYRMFLDQFAGEELMDLAPSLGPGAFGALEEYAQTSVDTRSGRAADLLPSLRSARAVKAARKSAAERVAQLLRGAGQIGNRAERDESIRTALVESLRAPGLGKLVMRRLFACETRPDRFSRLSRIWTGRVADRVREGDIDAALVALDEVLVDPPYAIGRQPEVDTALARLASSELLSDLVDRGDEDGGVTRLLKKLGTPAVEALVERMAVEENAQTRRALIDLIAVVGRSDHRLLADRLSDPRWYVVRNLATVLGRTGQVRAAVPLKRLLKHDDHRVRSEALRSLRLLLRDDAVDVLGKALGDPHERVRHAARTLLGSIEASGADAALASEFREASRGADEMKAIARILADRGTPTARAVLEEAAGRSFAMRPQHRVAKAAAREVLRG